jgi:hypothetical protein
MTALVMLSTATFCLGTVASLDGWRHVFAAIETITTVVRGKLASVGSAQVCMGARSDAHDAGSWHVTCSSSRWGSFTQTAPDLLAPGLNGYSVALANPWLKRL